MYKRFIYIAAAFLLAAALIGCAGDKSLSGQESQPPPEIASPSETATPSAGVPSPSEAPSPQPSDTAESSPPAAHDAVSLSVNEYEYKTQYIETHIALPLAAGIDGEAGEKINAKFRDLMAAARESSSLSEADAKQREENGYIIDISYSVPYNKDGVLCILVSAYTYFGGAHGDTEWQPYVFDTRTGGELALGDLMEAGSGYRDYINGVIRREIDKRVEAGGVSEVIEFADIGDKPWFYLTAEGFVFFFQLYDYFPYASGIQQFDIPYGDLSSMLREEYDGLEITPVELEQGSNTLSAGDIGIVSLSGNATSGYSWKYEIKDVSVLELSSRDYTDDTADGAVGGGTYTWDFRAKKPGMTTVIFTYTQDWESGASPSPESPVQFTVTVE